MATGYLTPDPIVEVAFSTDVFNPLRPWNLPEEVDWVPLVHADGTTRCLSFDSDRGRTDQFDQFDPGTATFVLDDNDRMLDENNEASLVYGFQGGALTPIRFRVYNPYTEETSTIFTGYITHGWQPSTSATRDRFVTVRAVEWMGWAATREIPKAATGAFLADEEPLVWWRGELTRARITTSAGLVRDWSTTGDFDGNVAAGGSVQVADPLLTGSEYAMKLHTGAALTPALPLPTGDPEWSFFCAFQGEDMAGVGRDLAASRTTISGNRRWRVRLGTTGHLAVEIYNAAGTSLLSVTADDASGTPVAHNDGRPHFVYAEFTSTSIGIFSDLTQDGFSTFGFVGTEAGSGGYISTDSLTGPFTDARVIVSDWAYFDHALGSADTDLSIDGDSIDMWASDTVPVRAARLERLGRIPTNLGFWIPFGSAAADPLGGYVPQDNLGAAIQATGSAIAGGAFGTRDGMVQIYGYDDTVTLPHFTDITANLSNYEHAVDPIRYVGEGRSGLLLERVINEVRARGARLAFDQDSIDTYGRKVLEFDSLNTSEIVAYAASIVAERKDPTHELGALTINPVGSETATTWLLEECELGRMVTYEELTADGHYLSRYGSMQIQSESWSWSNGLDWSVTLKLAGGSEYELEYLLTEDDEQLNTETPGDIIVEG